jgi:hypothetical protein
MRVLRLLSVQNGLLGNIDQLAGFDVEVAEALAFFFIPLVDIAHVATGSVVDLHTGYVLATDA